MIWQPMSSKKRLFFNLGLQTILDLMGRFNVGGYALCSPSMENARRHAHASKAELVNVLKGLKVEIAQF